MNFDPVALSYRHRPRARVAGGYWRRAPRQFIARATQKTGRILWLRGANHDLVLAHLGAGDSPRTRSGAKSPSPAHFSAWDAEPCWAAGPGPPRPGRFVEGADGRRRASTWGRSSCWSAAAAFGGGFNAMTQLKGFQQTAWRHRAISPASGRTSTRAPRASRASRSVPAKSACGADANRRLRLGHAGVVRPRRRRQERDDGHLGPQVRAATRLRCCHATTAAGRTQTHFVDSASRIATAPNISCGPPADAEHAEGLGAALVAIASRCCP
jgi:hypothetical protein